MVSIYCTSKDLFIRESTPQRNYSSVNFGLVSNSQYDSARFLHSKSLSDLWSSNITIEDRKTLVARFDGPIGIHLEPNVLDYLLVKKFTYEFTDLSIPYNNRKIITFFDLIRITVLPKVMRKIAILLQSFSKRSTKSSKRWSKCHCQCYASQQKFCHCRVKNSETSGKTKGYKSEFTTLRKEESSLKGIRQTKSESPTQRSEHKGLDEYDGCNYTAYERKI
mmetsp:Transcript_10040/g.15054  ORF Transcript_10040/g.15054 Transcript_10040/m.15054 type:complete len:221 (+) Transcript_10040:521-1183(+)